MSRILYTGEKINQARTLLMDSPTIEKQVNATNAIKELKKEIQAARKSGKTWKEIAEILGKAEITATPALLSSVFVMKKPKKKNEEKLEEKIKNTDKKKEEKSEKVEGAKFGAITIEPGTFKVKPDRKKL